MTKDEEIAILKAQNAELLQRVATLEEKVLQLLQIIEKQGVKKDSRNSHNSPSQDKSKPKRNQYLIALTLHKFYVAIFVRNAERIYGKKLMSF